VTQQVKKLHIPLCSTEYLSSTFRSEFLLNAREDEKCIQILVAKPDGKRPLGRPRCRWGIILKWILKK
jgi:hypothetical protein